MDIMPRLERAVPGSIPGRGARANCRSGLHLSNVMSGSRTSLAPLTGSAQLPDGSTSNFGLEAVLSPFLVGCFGPTAGAEYMTRRLQVQVLPGARVLP